MAILEVKDRTLIERVRLFVDLGFKDYVAARVLLNNELVLQGATLASASIEKYFRAVTAVTGNQVLGHLQEGHLQALYAADPIFFAKLNQSFLKMLQVVYDLRYLDNPEKAAPGITISLQRRPILAELDFTVTTLVQKFTFWRHKEKLNTLFDQMLESQDPRLWENNYVLGNLDKNKFIANRDIVYSMYIDKRFKLVENLYEVERASTDGNFLAPGLAQTIA
jgi:hypothetical protein